MKAIVISNKKEANNAKVLRIKPKKDMNFIPGQFILIHYKNIKRAYSITSIPSEKKFLELVFDLKPNGLVSKYLYNIKPKYILEISDPVGRFTFNESISNDLVLIGTGTGIAPLISIIRYIKKQKLKNRITLIYSCKTNKDILYKKELMELYKNKNINYYQILTQEKLYKGITERININIVKDLIKDFDNKLFYICGSPQMVIDLSKSLKINGVKESNVKIEGYD